MSDRQGNPRELREVNARFQYDVRNRGVAAAVDGMHARNAQRRKEDERQAKRKTADRLAKAADEELRKLKRADFSKLTD